MPELRKDPIVGRWVIIAHERAKRPHDFKSEALVADASARRAPPVAQVFEPRDRSRHADRLKRALFGPNPNAT